MLILVRILPVAVVVAMVWMMVRSVKKSRVRLEREKRLGELSEEFFSIQNKRWDWLQGHRHERDSRHHQDLLKREVQTALRCARTSVRQHDMEFYAKLGLSALNEISDPEFVTRYSPQVLAFISTPVQTTLCFGQ